MAHPQVRHLPGRHCASSGLRDLCEHHGLSFSEAMCFGLGAGLGIWYFDPGGPSRMVHVRSADVEDRFFTRLGSSFAWERFDNPGDGENALIRALDEGRPVLLQTDIFHLPYYRTSTHFPGHVIVAWGFDPGRRVFFVTDTERPEVQEVPFKAMRKARYAVGGFLDMRGNQFAPQSLSRPGDLAALVREALVENSARLLNPGPDHQGLGALEKWLSELDAWAGFDDWKWTARLAYQVIEKRGTGGGGFRLMYADFLDE
ncbi:MAG: BtrH N-terminal domain-containing protein, partial [Proteobacteria bacterium]|nr:BtrH N-terminal domain-containing protein [Pseudomonadota bacterium]